MPDFYTDPAWASWTPPAPVKRRPGRPTNVERGIPAPAVRRTPDENRKRNRELLAAALAATIPGQYEEVGECAYLTSAHFTDPTIRTLQAHLPGTTFAIRDTGGVVWTNGGNGPHGYILTSAATVQKVQRIHRLLADVIPSQQLGRRILPYTFGGCGGALIRWVGWDGWIDLPGMESRLTAESVHAYRYCKPGRYQDMIYWDVKQFYPSLLRRLPSPNVMIIGKRDDPHETRVLCPRLAPDQQDRWEIAVHQVCLNKDLYTAFIGKMHGSREAKHGLNYTRGKDGAVRSYVSGGRVGKMPIAGRLLVRAGYELTQAEAQATGSVWSHTDCVISPRSRPPRVWEAFGLTVEIKRGREGDAHIVNPNTYSIGDYKTKGYTMSKLGLPQSLDLGALGLDPLALALERAAETARAQADFDDEDDAPIYEAEPGDNKLSVLYHKITPWL